VIALKDREALLPNRRKITYADGSVEYVTIEYADQPTIEGTPLSKATFLTNETATALGLNPDDDPLVDDALLRLQTNKASTTHASQHYVGGSDPTALRPTVITFLAASWTATDHIKAKTDVSGGSVAITGATFKSAVSNTVGVYVFTYVSSESSWQLDGTNVSLATYGITLTGTPSDADTITAEYAVKYVQSVSCSGITSSMKPKIDLYLDDDDLMSDQTDQEDAFANVSKIDSGTNAIILTCNRTEPTVDFYLAVEVAL